MAWHFFAVPHATLDITLSLQARGLYSILCSYLPGRGAKMCWPSTKTLCELAGVSKRHAFRLLDELESAGLIKRQARHDPTGRQISSMIDMVDHSTLGGARATRDDTDATRGVMDVTPGGDTGVTLPPHPDIISKTDELEPDELEPSRNGGAPAAPEVDVVKPADEVIAHYRTHHPTTRGKFAAERKLIDQHLKNGFSVADLKDAIDGCHMTPHNLGENDRRTAYLDLELIMRNESNVRRFMQTKREPRAKPRTSLGPGLDHLFGPNFKGGDFATPSRNGKAISNDQR